MPLEKGATNKIIRLATNFDMSLNTDLRMKFVKTPNDGTAATEETKTKTGGEVVLGTAPITDPELGPLNANEYADYATEVGFLDFTGTLCATLAYLDSGTTPPTEYIGAQVTFNVVAGECELAA